MLRSAHAVMGLSARLIGTGFSVFDLFGYGAGIVVIAAVDRALVSGFLSGQSRPAAQPDLARFRHHEKTRVRR